MKNLVKTLMLAGAMLVIPAFAAAKTEKTLEEKVRHELVTLPWFGVFDTMSFRVDGDTVTLFGSVTRPTLRTSAENVVKRLEGVSRVSNQIEVLPLSPFDDRIRIATARAIYGYAPLQRYALGANPPIRIIVKNGNVTLDGVVASEMDRNLAFVRANGVAGSFAVTNNLRISTT